MSIYDELSEEELLALQNGEYEKLSENTLLKLQGGSQPEPQKPKGFLENLLSPQSPASDWERARFALGNPEGVLDYLKKQGVNAEYRNGELFINNQQVDPNGLETLFNMSPIVQVYQHVKELLYPESRIDPRQKLNDVVNTAKDIAPDIGELPADALNMILSTLGGVGGAAGAGPVGMVGGSALGGGAAEKVKEFLGSKLGVYKTDGEYLTPETKQSALIAGASAVPGAVYQGGKNVAKYVSEKGLKWKVPQRIYASGTGLGDEFSDNPKTLDILLKEGVTGGKGKLREISAQKMKEVYGPQIDEILKKYPDINLDDVLARVNSAKFPSTLGSGSRATGQNSLDEVLSEFKDLFKTQTTPSTGGVMKRPSYESFKSDFVEKYGSKKPVSAYVSDPDPADLTDLLEYGLTPKKGAPSGNVRILRSGNGVPVAQTPIYSETRTTGRKTPLGRDVSWTEPIKEVYTPGKPNIIKEGSITPNEEDIARIYQQLYPQENISLAEIPGKTTQTIDLKSLNAEKSRLSKEASSVYDNPDVKAQITAKAKKQVADASRDAIYSNVGEDEAALRELNQKYHAYDALDESLDKILKRANRKPITSLGLSDLGIGAGAATAAGGPAGVAAIATKKTLDSTPVQTNVASWLYKMLNKGAGASANYGAAMPTQQALQELARQIMRSRNNLQQEP